MLRLVGPVLSIWIKPLSVAIQITAVKQYFPVVLLIMLYKVIINFWTCVWNPKTYHFQMKAIAQLFLIIAVIMLCKMIPLKIELTK